MKIRITHSSHIINFLDVGFDTDEISKNLALKIEEKLKGVDLQSLKEWVVDFHIVYNKTQDVLIYKKSRSISEYKTKEIAIHIPIPLSNEATWGVEPNQYIQGGKIPDITKFEIIQVDFSCYKYRSEYIEKSIIIAIKRCFTSGFTINGKKVKLNLD